MEDIMVRKKIVPSSELGEFATLLHALLKERGQVNAIVVVDGSRRYIDTRYWHRHVRIIVNEQKSLPSTWVVTLQISNDGNRRDTYKKYPCQLVHSSFDAENFEATLGFFANVDTKLDPTEVELVVLAGPRAAGVFYTASNIINIICRNMRPL
jgi:hypothetical protein